MNPLPPALTPAGRTRVLWRGRRMTYFAGCDYFRLSTHPDTIRAAIAASRTYGLSVGASRLTTGNSPLLVELEQELARFLLAPAALITPTGSSANACLGESLHGEFTHVLLEERSHPSLKDAVSGLGASILPFGHRDPDSVQRLVSTIPPSARLLLATDGVFALDGAIAPLRKYRDVLPESAWMWVDDCHGAGTVGSTGAGTAQLEGVGNRQLLRTTTLSKAFGSYGGVILGSAARIRSVLQGSRTFASSTPPPPPSAAAALAALRVLGSDPTLRTRLTDRVRQIRDALSRSGIQVTASPAPIFCIIPDTAIQRARLERRLVLEGIHPPFIRYPGGPASGLFRFALSSEHSASQLRGLLRALEAE